MPDPGHGNVLGSEKSPYLLQHAGNPVHWLPWGSAAFEEARDRNVPILLSIGYATCHWCHVMAHESFEDQEIADFLNDHYVCIKVDREERPDVDSIYMDVCQSMTGRGGWPLTVIMDADQRPFFAGTYFPPRSRSNQIGFLDLAQRIAHAWDVDREKIDRSCQQIEKALVEGASASFRGDVPDDVFTIVADHHVRTYDDVHGGFSSQPKFPSPHHLLLLFRIAHRTGNGALVTMATHTIDAMRAGGLFDHVGFGFHRYSTDRQWLVPHFEKMLYDQAMMVMACTEAWQITGDDRYKDVVDEVAAYVRRELTSVEGAFFSAQDADSEGEEGRYYVWSYDELGTILSADDLSFLEEHMGLRRDGNFRDEVHGEDTAKNILHRPNLGPLDEDQRRQWTAIRSTLLRHRSQRIAPLTDDKILADWNGLMIGALARAGRVLSNETLLSMAASGYAAVTDLCGGTQWMHRYRDGHRAVPAMLDDHASMGWAATELYQSTGDEPYLVDARFHADQILTDFVIEDGALAATSARTNDLPVRPRTGFDSAYPSGNSMAALLFAQLGAITNSDTYLEASRAAVTSYGMHFERSAPGYCMLLCAWDALLHGPTEIVLDGETHAPFTTTAMKLVSQAYLPDAVIIHERGGEEGVRICSRRVCQRPLTTEADLV
jgi:uncharacterized protein